MIDTWLALMENETDNTTHKNTCLASIGSLYARMKKSSVAFVRRRKQVVSTLVYSKGSSASPYTILSEEEEQEELAKEVSRISASR